MRYPSSLRFKPRKIKRGRITKRDAQRIKICGNLRELVAQRWCEFLRNKGRIEDFKILPSRTPVRDMIIVLNNGARVSVNITGPKPVDMEEHRIKCDPHNVLVYPIALQDADSNDRPEAAYEFLRAVEKWSKRKIPD